MKLKHAIIRTMGRDDLKAVCADLEVDGVDRRSRDDMAAAVSRLRRMKPDFLLDYLNEKQVKEVCELVGASARGRRRALIERLLDSKPVVPPRAQPSSSAKAKKRTRSRPIVSPPPPPTTEEEDEVTWMSTDEAKNAPGAEQTQQSPSSPQRERPNSPNASRAKLVWPGKYDETGKLTEPPRVSLPFQVIEVIREGRASREALTQGTLPLFGAKPTGPEEDGWRNKIVWGDNRLVLNSLRKEFAGKVDLVYIDPPFDTGADFSFTTEIPGTSERIEKQPSAIEQKAYRDTWGSGLESYLHWFYETVVLLRDLVSKDGSIYIHLDHHVCHYAKPILDEVFGSECFRNEIVWKRTNAHNSARRFGPVHDVLYYYALSSDAVWNPQFQAYDESYLKKFGKTDNVTGERFQDVTLTGPGTRKGASGQPWREFNPTDSGRHWQPASYVYEKYRSIAGEDLAQYPLIERLDKLDEIGLIYWPAKTGGQPRYKLYLTDARGVPIMDVWSDIYAVNSQAAERLGYPTQKPEALIERVVAGSSNPGQLVLDCFCGSGTTPAVAERLGRRWIGCDLGRFAVHTTRKRLLGLRVKDAQTGEERGCKPFAVLNLGRYERKYWQGITFGGDEREPDHIAIAAYVRFVLELYNAQPLPGQHIHGKKGGALVHVGAVDAPVTISQVENALREAEEKGARELHVLGWEWEMGLHDPLAKIAKAQHGVKLRLMNIPREVMEARAADAGDVQFFDLAYLKVGLKQAGRGGAASRRVKVQLTDFVIPNTDLIPDDVREKVKTWSDYIDYWAVDWDFRDDTFVNQWQTYRTPQDRTLTLATAEHNYDGPGKYRVLVKVVDIFGNDTSQLLTWEAK